MLEVLIKMTNQPDYNKSIIGTPRKKYEDIPDLTDEIIAWANEPMEPPKGNPPKVNEKKGSNLEEKAKDNKRSPIILQSNNDFWTIENVEYRDSIYKVDLLKDLLDKGNSKNQDDWVKYSKNAQDNNNFYVGDFPLYHSLFTSLHKLNDKPEIEEIRSFLQKQFIEKWLMTLTRIKYQSSGKDDIIHNYKMSDEYSVKDNFVGPDEYVKDSKNKINYKSLLGTDNLKEINEVYNWITGKDIYLWRLNSKPKSLDERVAWFGANSARAILSCSWGPSDINSSLGVRAVRHGVELFAGKLNNVGGSD
jgi:hypothetical protein